MAERRRLPVIQSDARGPSSGSGSGSGGSPGGGAPDEPTEQPPWHWVPIGAVVAIAVGVVLAKSFYMPFMQRRIERVYGRLGSSAEFERVDRALAPAARDALHFELAVAAVVVALVAVAIGGFVVGRFGARTNRRHGTLAGVTAITLLVLFGGRGLTGAGVLGYMALIPFGGLAGYLGAMFGEWLRHRAQRADGGGA
jgi:hypothetical protein